MNPGECFFTFFNTTTMSISCTSDTSNNESTIPATVLTSSYMANIIHITYSPTISSLPLYLCSLPSREIDLSYEAFTTLSDATFPCLDYFLKVRLAYNQITSVNITNGNFKNLTALDLSSNYLTMLPYTILNPTPTSLDYLDLRNNSIRYLDLFLYTRKNITILLDNNPINSSDIINPQNVILGNVTNATTNITFSSNVTTSTIIITDSIAVTYGLCNNFQTLRNLLLDLRSQGFTVYTDCSCNSVYTRNLYQANGLNITNDFSCSLKAQITSFYALNTSSCDNGTNIFLTGLCINEVCLITFHFSLKNLNKSIKKGKLRSI
jgi:hypothetical protein